VRFPLEELGFDVNLYQSTFTPIPILSDLLIEPLFRFAKSDNPVPAMFFGALVGGAVGYLGADGAVAGLMNKEAAKQLSKDDGDLGNALGFKDGSGRFVVEGLGPAGAFVGANVGFIGGAALWAGLHSTVSTEATVNAPAGIRLTNLVINAGAASLFLDVDPIFGDVDVISFTGLSAAREPVSLSPDDVYLGQENLGEHEDHPLHLVYRGEGSQRGFTTLWVKRNVSALQLKCRLNTRFAGRYNSPAFPTYKLEYRDLNGAPFAVPSDYAYNPDIDEGEFTLEIPVLEGTGGLHAVRLTLPGPQSKTICFFVGKDTSPILINQPFAAYSALSSNVTIHAGTLAYWNATGPKPSFTLEALKLLDLRDGITTTSLLQPGIFSSSLVPGDLTPAETHTPRLYGKTYAWTGRLPTNAFPDGVYTVLVTIKETAMNRRGTLLIPLILDRTPPDLAVWKSYDSQVVVSRYVNLPLEWSARDQGSAVLHDLYLTYAANGGPSLTGAVFTAPGQVLPPGQRHLDFNVDYAVAPDGPYTLQIHGADVPGNQGVSTNVAFIVDTQPPPLDALFLYPATTGAYDSLLTRSNRLLTVKAQSREPFNARFLLTGTEGDAQSWYARSQRIPGGDGNHMAIWTLEIPETDPDQGLLEGSLRDGAYKLSVELVDRGDNTNLVSNLRTVLIDRRPPVIAFKTQPPLVPSSASSYPLDLDLSGMVAGDAITSIALVNLNGFTSSSTVEGATLRSWTTPSEIAALRSGGIPLVVPPAGTPLPAGFYGVEVKATDAAGNTSRIVTMFAYRMIIPALEIAGGSPAHGIVTLLGVATDPNPADPFPFKSRELYWARGNNVTAPANLGAIDPAIWKTAGLYVMPPHGPGSAVRDNESLEPVAKGTLGYWNTTAAGVVLSGPSPVTLSSAGLIDDDVTVMVVVRDQGGQAWSATASTHIDNRSVDANALTAPQLQITQAAVQDHRLTVSAGLLSDAHSVQMVVLDPAGNPVHSEALGSVSTSNGLLGKPGYSLETDFGFFVWYDTNFSQLRIRCVAPEQDSAGNLLAVGHTFYFAVQGPFATNDITSLRVAADEQPRGGSLATLSNGDLRVMYALTVAPGDEKGINIAYHGGTLQFGALGIDEYAQALYTSGTRVTRRYWRSDDSASVFPGYDSLTRVKNLAGLDGIVMRGSVPEFPDPKAIANHSGAVGHVFTGRQRNAPASPLGIQFDGAQLHPDVTLGWDLKLPNGGLASPGNYRVYVFSQREDGQGFNGAVANVTLAPADVPLTLTSLTATGGGKFDPRTDGAITFGFLPSRSAQVTVRVLDGVRNTVATLLNGVLVQGGATPTTRSGWPGRGMRTASRCRPATIRFRWRSRPTG
jgi:hypothetical protein